MGTTRKLTCFVRRRKETKKQSKKSMQKPSEASSLEMCRKQKAMWSTTKNYRFEGEIETCCRFSSPFVHFSVEQLRKMKLKEG